MCAGREFQVEGADTENAREEKLLVIPAGLVRRFVLEERKDLGEGGISDTAISPSVCPMA